VLGDLPERDSPAGVRGHGTIPVRVRFGRWITATVAFGAIIVVLVAATLVLRQQLAASLAEIERIALEGKSVEESIDTVLLRLSEVAIASRALLIAGRPEVDRRAGELLESTDSLRQAMDEFPSKDSPEVGPALRSLREVVQRYLAETEKLPKLSEKERLAQGTVLINDMMTPLRQTVRSELVQVRVAQEARLESQRRQLLAEYDSLNQNLLTFGVLIVGLVGAIAMYTVLRLRRLEDQGVQQAEELAASRDELRKLSQGLVEAQESERKRLSRELHDEVGQLVTALRMEIGNLGDLHERKSGAFGERWRSAKQLGDQVLQVIRDISMGLRPSMLDDLGLEPAIKWQARDFTRRSGIDVEVRTEGELDQLPERHRIHAYRIVQESLTNIAKHARARHVVITAHQSAGQFTITISDDGEGFDSHAQAEGAGLLGIRERIQELEGRCEIFSQPGQGTVINVEIPLENTRVHV
jgi:signal transduction histidine kinase